VSIQRRAGYRNFSDAEGERQENNTKLKPYPLLDHEESEHMDHLKSQNHFEPDLVLCRSRFPKRKIFRELENSEHNVPTTHSMNPQYSTIGSTRVVDEMERWRSLRSTPFCKMESKSAPTDPKRTTDEPTSTPTDPKRASDEPTSTPLKESVGNEVIPTEVPIPKGSLRLSILAGATAVPLKRSLFLQTQRSMYLVHLQKNHTLTYLNIFRDRILPQPRWDGVKKVLHL
jgi:hypothetical protein